MVTYLILLVADAQISVNTKSLSSPRLKHVIRAIAVHLILTEIILVLFHDLDIAKDHMSGLGGVFQMYFYIKSCYKFPAHVRLKGSVRVP